MKKTRRPKKKDLKHVAFTRFMLVIGFFVLWIGGIGVRLVYLQVTQHDWLRNKAVSMRRDVRESTMPRGNIYDRNGRTLAMSLRAKTLYADPQEIENVGETAAILSKHLKLNAAELSRDLQEAKDARRRFVAIARKLDEEAFQDLNRALDRPDVRKADLPNYPGLHWDDEQKRLYPQKTLAAHIVGVSNDNDDGVAGIERSQNEVLQGAVIKRLQQRDRLGRVYDEEVAERTVPGDVVLTIDSAMQYMVEQALAAGVKAADAKAGMVTVLSAKTGEVLAMANYPTFDPNSLDARSQDLLLNHSVQSVYSPGSVFKLLTYGVGLEKKQFVPTDMISSGNGSIEVAKHVFRDSHPVGTVSYSQAMAHSSNVCAIKTAMGAGRDDFAAMVQKMGFGEKTGIELPAETAGIVRPVSKWNGDSLASLSIGYEIGVSALQMATAFATIANNGVRVRPRVIKEVRRPGETPQPTAAEEQTQVVSPETARHLRTMLKQVVLTGTGRRAQLNGYTAAGKTGTAWKFNPKTRAVDPTKYISSFIGMAPADSPELVIAVTIDEPRSGSRDGGRVAAPVFREIAQQLLHELKVPTDAPIRQENIAETAIDIPETPVGDPGASPKTELDDKKAAKTEKPGTNETKGETPERGKKRMPVPEKDGDEKEKPKVQAERLRLSAVRWPVPETLSATRFGYRFET